MRDADELVAGTNPADAAWVLKLSIGWNETRTAWILSWPLTRAGVVLQATNALPSIAMPWPVIPPPYQPSGAHLQ